MRCLLQIKSVFAGFCLLVLPLPARALRLRPDWQNWLRAREITGCLMVQINNDAIQVSNGPACHKGHLPASTAKIFNALAGLESSMLKDKDTLFKWDGQRRSFPEWNQDHTLASAMRDSAIWYFQETARQVGKEKLKEYMARIPYGNQNLEAGADQWWLWGKFRITPMEQLQLVRRLALEALPFKKRNQRIAREILLDKKREAFSLYARSGILRVKKVEVWWVGFVEQADRRIFFAFFYEPEDDLYDPEQFPEKYGCARSALQLELEKIAALESPERGRAEAAARDRQKKMHERIKEVAFTELSAEEKDESNRLDCQKKASSQFNLKRNSFYGARREIVYRAIFQQTGLKLWE